MKIEAGKYYRTRDGRKVGPMERVDPLGTFMGCNGELWSIGGHRLPHGPHPRDLIAEWTDEPTSPVRTVTRREVVPGYYGMVVVFNDGSVQMRNTSSAPELRAAAATLIEIADALDDTTTEPAKEYWIGRNSFTGMLDFCTEPMEGYTRFKEVRE